VNADDLYDNLKPECNWKKCCGADCNKSNFLSVLKQFIIVFVPTSLPLVLMALTIQGLRGEHPASEMQMFLLGMIFVMLILLMLLGVVLLQVTNEDSISGMVAQRYNKISYLTILLICGISFFTSCFVIAGAIVREKLCKETSHSISIAGALSPLFACCILVAPIVVVKDVYELSMIPLNVPSALVDDTTHHGPVPLLPRSSSLKRTNSNSNNKPNKSKSKSKSNLNTTTSSPPTPTFSLDADGSKVSVIAARKNLLLARAQHQGGGGGHEQESNRPQIRQFKMTFFPGVSPKWHRTMHFTAVGLGVGTGYVAIISHLVNTYDNFRTYSALNQHCWNMELALVIVSFICLSMFIGAGFIGDESPNPHEVPIRRKRISMYTEFLGLFYYLVAIIYASAIGGDLVNSSTSQCPR